MTFQPWRDYLQLSSVIQNMVKADISDPPPLRDLLLSPAERSEGYAMNQQNDQMDLNFILSFLPDEAMGYADPNMNTDLQPKRTRFHIRANGPPNSTEDQAVVFPSNNMAKSDIFDPPPLRDLLLIPAERSQGYAMNQQNDQMDLNFILSYLPNEAMGYADPNMNTDLQPKRTRFHNRANGPPNSTEDQAVVFPSNNNQPNLLASNFHRQTNSHSTNNSFQQLSSLLQGETSNGGMCYFCKHNGESRHIYMGHNLKDEQGRVICPVLRMYSCSLCGATGEMSHTKKYCPLNKDKGCLYKKSGRNSAGQKMRR